MSGRKFAILLGAVLWLSVGAAPAAHAGDDGLLGDTAHVVGDAVETVDPVVQSVQPLAPQPMQPEPVVPPTLTPLTTEVVEHAAAAEREVERAAEATVRLAEQAVQPVVRITEPTDRRADEPAAEEVDPAGPPSATPAALETATTSGTPGSPADDVLIGDGAQPVPAASHGPGDAQRPRRSAQRLFVMDTARIPLAAPPHIARIADDRRRDQRLWTLTNQLMHMWAGDRAPNGVHAGLVGDETPGSRVSGAFDIAPLLSGLALGVAAMVLARRGRRAHRVEDRSRRIRTIFDHHVSARPSR